MESGSIFSLQTLYPFVVLRNFTDVRILMLFAVKTLMILTHLISNRSRKGGETSIVDVVSQLVESSGVYQTVTWGRINCWQNPNWSRDFRVGLQRMG